MRVLQSLNMFRMKLLEFPFTPDFIQRVCCAISISAHWRKCLTPCPFSNMVWKCKSSFSPAKLRMTASFFGFGYVSIATRKETHLPFLLSSGRRCCRFLSQDKHSMRHYLQGSISMTHKGCIYGLDFSSTKSKYTLLFAEFSSLDCFKPEWELVCNYSWFVSVGHFTSRFSFQGTDVYHNQKSSHRNTYKCTAPSTLEHMW